AQLLIDMDEEFQALLKKLGLKEGAIPSILQYYESTDAESLTKKLHSISAFKGISSPMITNKFGKFEPDFTSRYFTEDFPYGMKFIVETGEKYQCPMPTINKVYQWGLSKIQIN
ncbi:MAG: NAD/NADP octopine/nopaline dehydrogenase family protein, partial [Bacteroidaceae bacterium]|nr:NAD/NADP octopine/nopaline dehydrogenase family protein [Bacteroidaceae bacterium]